MCGAAHNRASTILENSDQQAGTRCRHGLDPARSPASSLRRRPIGRVDGRVETIRGGPIMTGQTVTHYRGGEKPGEGGSAAVYRARSVGREVVLKFFASGGAGNLARLQHEALEKQPALRYQTASDVRADLQQLKRDAMGTYIEIANRFPVSSRAPEALLKLAESTLKSKDRDKEQAARRTLTELVKQYPGSPAARRPAWRGRADGGRHVSRDRRPVPLERFGSFRVEQAGADLHRDETLRACRCHV